MKRVLWIFILLILLAPFKSEAVSISGVTITGADEIEKGQQITLTFSVKASGIEKKSDTLGIWVAYFSLQYDEDVLEPVAKDSPGFTTLIYPYNDQNIVFGEVIEDSSYNKECVNGLLYCDDYVVKLSFYVNDVSNTSTTIAVKEAGLGVLDMTDPDKEYNEDDMTEITYTSGTAKTIILKEATGTASKKPSTIVSNSKPNTSKKSSSSKKETSSSTSNSSSSNKEDDKTVIAPKSKNNNLKSLVITNYDLSFDKNRHIYDLNIRKEINKLEVKVTLEDKKASYEIIGADDLKKNDYKVVIKVTAENGDVNNYVINTNNEEETVTQAPEKKFNITKKHLIIGSIIIGGVVVVGLLISFVIHRKDRKLERSLDEL